MKKFIDLFDHLCSIEDYSSIGSMQILSDGSVFLHVVQVLDPKDPEIIVKLPLLKYHKVDPRHIIAEIEEELKRKYQAPSVFDLGFDEIVEKIVSDHGKSRRFHPLYLAMPHHPNQDFYDESGQLCSVMFNDKDSIKFNVSQIDVDLFGSLPYNLLYSVVFASIFANMTGCRLIECNFDFMNPYVRREDLPKVAQLIEEEPPLDICKIRIKKPIKDLSKFNEKYIEIEIQ